MNNVIDLMDGKKITKESKIIYYPLKDEVYIIDFLDSFHFDHIQKDNNDAFQLPIWRQRDVRLSPFTSAKLSFILSEHNKKNQIIDNKISHNKVGDDDFGEWIGAGESSQHPFRNI